jgi:phospholipid transport system substrate-binding protein
MSTLLRCAGLVFVLFFTPRLDSADAAADDSAAVQVQHLDAALLESMQAGPALSVGDRYHKLEPVIEQAFDLPLMTSLAVGPDWASFSGEQQRAAIAAFTRLTIASYAHNFRAYGGEKFEIDANIVSRGIDKVVQTHLIPLHDQPVSLIYRMRESGGVWKIIDVYYGSISQLTTRRSDFAGPVASGGAQALVTHLNSLSDDLMK